MAEKVTAWFKGLFGGSPEEATQAAEKLDKELDATEEAAEEAVEEAVEQLEEAVEEMEVQVEAAVNEIAERSGSLDLAPIDAVQADLEDSNIAGIGSEENRDLRAEAAATEIQFKKAGTKVGVEVWRVENKRTKSDTPDFGVRRWDKSMYGSFFAGDAYIVLNTYYRKDPVTGRNTDALAWDVHFWLGKECTQDERGVAAYKTVELDDLLRDGAVQHRETQFHESKMFQSYFKELVYLDGGIASGFRAVKPREYEPRLFLVRSSNKTTRAFQIPVAASNLNHGDVFVLDAGRKVYRYTGNQSTFFERNKSGLLQSNIVSGRNGKAKKGVVDDEFWAILGGSEEDVKEANDEDIFLPDSVREAEEAVNGSFDEALTKLYRISDDSGAVTFTLEAEGGRVPYKSLDPNDVFVLHTNIGLWVWLGSKASRAEKSQAMKIADEYIASEGLPDSLPVNAIREETAVTNHLFTSLFSF